VKIRCDIMYIVETKKNGLDGSVENNIVIITQ
jgi:hypothetical protein